MSLQPLLEAEPESIRCPYPLYAKLRAGGVAWDEGGGFFVVTTYEDCEYVLTHPMLFSSQNPMGPSVLATAIAMEGALSHAPELAQRAAALAGTRGQVLFTADPPDHTRHRKLLNKALTPRAVAALEPQLRAICHRLIDGFIDQGRVELVGAYASQLPVLAVGLLFGVPEDRTSDFLRWGTAINSSIGASMSEQEVQQCIADQLDFLDHFAEEIKARQIEPTDDLLTAVAFARDGDEEPFTLDEMLGMAGQILGAGVDTTNKLMGSAMYALCASPTLMEAVSTHPDLLPKFFEETLRTESPVQGLFRTATEDVELAGVMIPAGSAVWVVFASANRDPEVFVDPDGFDMTRSNQSSHMAFGHGPHFCIGSPLARLEMRVGFETLFERLDDIQLVDESRVGYEASYVIHGVKQLDITFTAK